MKSWGLYSLKENMTISQIYAEITKHLATLAPDTRLIGGMFSE